MRRPLIVSAWLTLALIAPGVSGCGRDHSQHGSQANADSPALHVNTTRPARKTLVLTSVQPGRIEAYEETPLFARLDGDVGEITVDIGARVKKGDVLARLRMPERVEELNQKKALVKQALAEVEQAAKEINVAEEAAAAAKARIGEAQAGIIRAKGEFDRWQAEYERVKELAAGGSLSKKLVDEAAKQLESARGALQEATAKVESAKAVLGEKQALIGKARADHAAAQARHRSAEAAEKRIQALLTYAEIKAPFDGVVSQRNVHPGHLVQPGDTKTRPLFVVTRCDKLRLFVDVPEGEAALTDPGDPVTIRIPAVPGLVLEAKDGDAKAPRVTRTAWALHPTARTLRTEIELDNADGRLRPGMYATVTIRLEKRENALALPAAAVFSRDGNDYCWCVENGRAVRRAVHVGLRSGDEIEIRSGLSGNEVVVTTGVADLKEGQAVSTGS